ncbi:lipase family protein [uncultured Ornithinimicrobium sp.]|uniref:S9 family peptidase n=1 Tax=uncultured Ornithinimicrobium sp. TaxID=259307 RepID=UPI002591C296|nr:lipase family protein [uncultured Ornithinimicrobium sp.]
MGIVAADSEVGLPVVSQLRRYPQPAARLALRALGLASLGARHGVRLHRVLYPTTGVDGRPTVASGLVATPEGVRPHAVVSYQHATQTHRLHVPSAPHKLEGVMASLAFAGAGYVFVAPDYLGMGSSPGPHPYLHAETEGRAVVDLLAVLPRVLAEVGTAVPDRVALLGFSQGGHASLAALGKLTRTPQPFEVAAVASVAGAHRLAETVGPAVLSGRSAHHTTYLAALATSYARVYGQPLASIVRERWARRLPLLLDGRRSSMEVELALPRDPAHLLTRETVDDLVGAGEGWFPRRLAENSVGDVTTAAPVRFYVGGEDVDAPAEDAHRAAALVRTHGGRAQVVHVGAVDHKGTALVAVGLTREWFDEVLAVPEAPADAVTTGEADDGPATERALAGRSRLRSVHLPAVHLPAVPRPAVHLPTVHLPAVHLPLDRLRHSA